MKKRPSFKPSVEPLETRQLLDSAPLSPAAVLENQTRYLLQSMTGNPDGLTVDGKASLIDGIAQLGTIDVSKNALAQALQQPIGPVSPDVAPIYAEDLAAAERQVGALDDMEAITRAILSTKTVLDVQQNGHLANAVNAIPQSVEMETVVPSFTVVPSNNGVAVNFWNIPERVGMRYYDTPLPQVQGTGSITIQLPYYSNVQVAYVSAYWKVNGLGIANGGVAFQFVRGGTYNFNGQGIGLKDARFDRPKADAQVAKESIAALPSLAHGDVSRQFADEALTTLGLGNFGTDRDLAAKYSSSLYGATMNDDAAVLEQQAILKNSGRTDHLGWAESQVLDDRRNIQEFVAHAKSVAWEMLIVAVQNAFPRLVQEKAGNVIVRSGIMPGDTSGANVFRYIPNMPSEDQVYAALDAHFDELMALYKRLAGQDTQMTQREQYLAQRHPDASDDNPYASKQQILDAIDRGVAAGHISREQRAQMLALLNASYAESDQAKNVTPVATTVDDATWLAMTGVGIGGADETPGFWQSKRNTVTAQKTPALTDLLSKYVPTSADATVSIAGKQVRTDTAAGKIFLGLYQKLLSLRGNRDALALLCTEVESVLGVSGPELYNFARRQSDLAAFQSGLFSIFSQRGYDVTLAPSQDTFPAFLEYRGDVIRVHFSPSLTQDSAEHPVDHGIVNIVGLTKVPDANGNYAYPVISGEEKVASIDPTKLYVDFPATNVKNIGYAISTKVVFWNGNTADSKVFYGMPSVQGHPDIPLAIDFSQLSVSNENLSTAADTARKVNEDFILNTVKMHMPVTNAKQWTWDIGSDQHIGIDRDFYAADLNKIGGEAGELVYGVGNETMQGVVERMDNTYGSVTLRYTSVINGTSVDWYMKYLHLRISDTGTKDANGHRIFEAHDDQNHFLWNLVEGVTKIKGNGAVAAVGGRGPVYDANNTVVGISDTQYSTHVHMESGTYQNNGSTMVPMDMRKMLSGVVDHVTASDAGPDGQVQTYGDNATQNVTWNETLHAWVPKADKPENQMWLYFDQTAQQTATTRTPGYWTAWAEKVEERVKVTFKRSKFVDDNGQLQDKETWLMQSNETMRWSNAIRKFVPVLGQ